MRSFFLMLFFFATTFCQAQGVALPAWFKTSLKAKGLDKKYTISAYMKNASLQADFNGDSINDLAVLIIEKATKKKGILLVHGKTNQSFVFGAGTKFGNGSDNFKWAGQWLLYKKKTAYEQVFNKENGDLIADREVRLKHPAILIEDISDDSSVAGGIIYWNGKRYQWIHQGE